MELNIPNKLQSKYRDLEVRNLRFVVRTTDATLMGKYYGGWLDNLKEMGLDEDWIGDLFKRSYIICMTCKNPVHAYDNVIMCEVCNKVFQ